MNSEVEQRIVAMYFDNKDFEKNAKQTIDTLGELKENLDLEKSIKGFDELDKAAYDKARAPQDEIQKLAKEFGGMKEEDLTAAKQKEFYERAAEAARSSMLALQEFAETEAGGMVYDCLEKDISGLSKDIEKLERNQNNSIGLKDIQNNLQLLASRKTGLTEYGIKAGKADESVKEITDAIKRAQTVNLAAGAAQNGEVAEARARAKWTEGVKIGRAHV